MKVAVFSAHTYDKNFLDEANRREPAPFDLIYQEASLSLRR